MRRTTTTLVTTIVAAAVLSGCGGGSAYCDAVKKDQSSLNAFGKTKTDAAYATYAKVFMSVAKVSPAAVKQDWATLAKATENIIAVQKKAGVKLEDMADTAKVKDLDDGQLADLNTAYKAFNDTTTQRRAVVKNVLQECDITLK